MELCQLDNFYLYNLNHYQKIVNQRNKLLKDLSFNPSLRETLNIWDLQLVSFGSKIMERRKTFVDQLNEIICKTDDGNNVYTFEILEGEGYKFIESKSSKIPKYKYSSDAKEALAPVDDGAIFN